MASEKEKTKNQKSGEKLISKNRRASFEYELGETYEAGLALIGSEVKVLRNASADLSDAWCSIERGEAFLKGMNIPVMTGMLFGHEAKRTRKLLLHAREIEQIKRAVEREGMTVVATRLYFKGGRVKVELALAKGKKVADKREAVKEREATREARAAIARGRRGE
ncbi:MAG TPA: SsrA-binding protein SmpB [Polyangiaceae bacterium]|nr:SsrA-binding protein SmpB [Polyangiaceae bacterium]